MAKWLVNLCLAGTIFLAACTTATPVPAPTITPTFTIPPTQVPSPTYGWDSTGWTLVWSDEFNGVSIDSKNWNFEQGDGGWGNAEWEYYTNRSENARLENGMLVIEARKEPYEGSNNTSARINTHGLHEFQYGRIEARIKVPTGKGMWSAFWMMGNDFGKTAGWPNCGEIDIMEYGSGRPPANAMEAVDYASGKLPYDVFQTLHGPGYSGGKGIGSIHNLPAESLANDFHVYAIEWAENDVRWFVDDQQVFEVTPDKIPAGTKWVYDHPFYIILNLAVGGAFGMPNADTVFPEQMLVDYVRVYQQP